MFCLVFVWLKVYVSFGIRVAQSVCFVWYSCGLKSVSLCIRMAPRWLFVWLKERFAYT